MTYFSHIIDKILYNISEESSKNWKTSDYSFENKQKGLNNTKISHKVYIHTQKKKKVFNP